MNQNYFKYEIGFESQHDARQFDQKSWKSVLKSNFLNKEQHYI